eukprot:429229_1
MKLTWFAANVVVVALTLQFLIRSVTLSDASTIGDDTVPINSVPVPGKKGLASTSWKCRCGFEMNVPSSSKCAFCKEENAAFVLRHTCEPSNDGLASTSWKCICGFEMNVPSSSKCAFCKEENAAFVLPRTCEPSNAGSGDYTDDIISTEKDKTDGSTTGDVTVPINLASIPGKKVIPDDYTDDIISTEKDKTATNDGSRESTTTLFVCFVLFICLAILGGVQFAIFKHHRTVYQDFEDASLIEDNDNPE